MISIIVPVYNVAPYIAECLESIRAQTYTNFEAILVDDGSTDASGRICDWYSKKDKRFHVIHKMNGGVSSARNVGIDTAKGEFIAFIDPDDYISMNFYECLYENIRKYDADFAGCKTCEVTESGEDYLESIISNTKIRTTEKDKLEAANIVKHIFFGAGIVNPIFYNGSSAVIDAVLKNQFSCVSWNKLFSKELWGKERFPENLSLGEDMAITIDIVTNAKRAVYVPESVYYWRQRKKSLLHGTVTFDRFLEDLTGSETMKSKFLAKHPDRENEINNLKFLYDSGCVTNFLVTAIKSEEKGSLLYKMLFGSA